jgi:hypothetical protein
VPSKKPTDKEEGEARAKAFEQMYKESHPDGPYPSVRTEARAKTAAASREELKSLL